MTTLTTDRIIEILRELNIPCFKDGGNPDYSVHIGRDLSMLDWEFSDRGGYSLEMGYTAADGRLLKERFIKTEAELLAAIVKYDMVKFYADQWYDGALFPKDRS